MKCLGLGFLGSSFFITTGIVDHYTSPHTIPIRYHAHIFEIYANECTRQAAMKTCAGEIAYR